MANVFDVCEAFDFNLCGGEAFGARFLVRRHRSQDLGVGGELLVGVLHHLVQLGLKRSVAVVQLLSL